MRWMLHGKWNCQIWGGTVLVDGTSKWVLCKINDAESLEGKTVAEIIEQALGQVPEQKKYSTVVISAGIINYEGTIPLPSGYNRSQCKYAAWVTGSANDTSDILLDVNQDTGFVRVRYGSDGTRYMNAGYLCIAVK